MRPCASYGKETTDSHFGRAGFPLQGFLLHTSRSSTNETGELEFEPIKTVSHFFSEHGVEANHHFTLTCFQQWLGRQTTEDAYDSKKLERLMIFSDGHSAQNWSVNVFGNMVRIVNGFKLSGFFPELKWLGFAKSVAGHGKSGNILILVFCLIVFVELDGEFSCPKGLIRKRSKVGGAVGPNQSNPTTGSGVAYEVVNYLNASRLFSPQFRPSKPDLQDFTLKKRYAVYANVANTEFGMFGYLSHVLTSSIAKMNPVTGTRKMLAVKFLYDEDGLFDELNAHCFYSYDDMQFERNPNVIELDKADSLLNSSVSDNVRNRLRL